MAHTPTTKKRRRGWAWTLTITAALLAVAWVVSMKVWVMAYLPPRITAFVIDGGLAVLWNHQSLPGSPSIELNVSSTWSTVWWFEFHKSQFGNSTTTELHAPLWPFVLLTGIPGVWLLFKTRKHTNPHACPACGYDRTGLTQTPTGPAPCPECGKGKDENR